MQKSLCAYVLLIIACLLPTVSNGYFLGLKSWDNTVSNIKRVEKEIGIQLPVVSFIFDPRDDMAYNTVASLPTELGRQKIYHITVSPQNTAKEVAEGQADGMYRAFFELIRDIHIKVVFRTMHEMNGGRYPWGSDPANFAKAWQRIWKISREVGLSKEEILFDMSVNGWDIPTRDAVPHQGSPLFFCFPGQKHKLNCPTFEDYYPGDDYVDLMGFTFYNRGKGNANRLWQAPYEIIDHPQRRTLTRLKKFDKPLFIDEVGTTAVRYNEKYSQQKSKEVFQTESWRKNAWLDSLSSFLDKEDRIVGSIYFNIDLTYGLEHRQQGEADRSIFDPATNKVYEGGKRLFENASDNNIMSTPLYDVFGIRRMMWGKKMIWVSKKYGKQALALLKDLDVNDTTLYSGGKVAIESYEKKIKASKLSKTQQTSRQYIINEAKKIIAQ